MGHPQNQPDPVYDDPGQNQGCLLQLGSVQVEVEGPSLVGLHASLSDPTETISVGSPQQTLNNFRYFCLQRKVRLNFPGHWSQP